MAKIQTALKTTVRWLWLTLALLIIGTVILVVIGRQTIANLDQARQPIQQFLTDRVGLQVDLGELRGEWPRLVPVIEVGEISVHAAEDAPALMLEGVRADLDLFNSLLHRSPIWRELAVERMRLTMVENASGHWSLQGFKSGVRTDLSLIIDPLTYSRVIRFDDIEVDLVFYSGKKMSLSGRNLAMENTPDFHRAELSLVLSEQMATLSDGEAETPAYLLIEGQGDLADVESFSAEGYFRFHDLNLSEPLADLLRSLLPQLFANLSDFKANANGELWFELHPGGALDFEGNLAIGEVPLNWLADVPAVTDIKTDITGWFTPGVDWGARLQGFRFDWSDTSIEPLDLVFNQQLGSQWKSFDLSVNHLDLNLLSDLLSKTRIADKKILDIVDRLRPQGMVDALTLGHNDKGYYASANLQALTLASWKTAPGVKGLDGFLEVYGTHGLFAVSDDNGFEALFPTVYKQYLAIDKASGTVNFSWSPNDKLLTLRSDIMHTELDAGVASMMFSVEQSIPSQGIPPEVSLLIGSRDLDIKQRTKYIPYRTPEKLSEWLQAAIVDGQVEEFGLLIRNGPPRRDPLSQTTQLMVKMSDADIDYDPNWTGIREAKAVALVDDTYSEVTLYSGKVGDAQVTDALVVYDKVGVDNDAVLTVKADVQGTLKSAIEILAESPLKSRLGALTGWDYTGDISSRLDLVIPLPVATENGESRGAAPAVNNIAPQYNITTVVERGSLAIPGGPIAVEEINGQVDFSLDKGLYGEDIDASFWQRPMRARLFRLGEEQKIAVTGDVLPDSLNRLVKFPWQEVLKGVIAVDSVITLPGSPGGEVNAQPAAPLTIQVNSQLKGVELALPAPLGKSVAESRNLDMTLYFSSELERLQGTLAGIKRASNQAADINFDMRFDQGAMTGAAVDYDREISIPEPGIVRVAAHLPSGDLETWEPLMSLFRRQDSASVASWTPVFDLRLDKMELATITFSDIRAVATLSEGLADVEFFSDLADGQLLMPLAQAASGAVPVSVPKLNLSRLTVPGSMLEKRLTESTIDPRQFNALDFSVDRLQVAGEDWGSIAFQLRPEVSGASFSRIRGDFLGLQPGAFDDQPATEFFWRFDGSDYSSRLVGPVGVGNIANFLSLGLGIPKIVDSRSGRFIFDLAWQDQPWNISRGNLKGEFQVELKEGSFYRSAGGAGAALKMVSLVNFANWLRRLKLDFSDVVGQNLSYNKLNGTLQFDQGIASFKQPLKMAMPSGRMSMAGNFDLLNEEVDARLVATLPVATNLPWVVALLGGLPAAAGVYVTSKLVEKQVDRLSSISYKLNGPWDDIEIAVDRIFASELRGDAIGSSAEKAEKASDREQK